jgi:trehalose 6-phosphate synthase/phosphatase
VIAPKLIVASTRLPVSVSRGDDGHWHVAASPGGLATALRAVAAHRGFTWVGWPGATIALADRDAVSAELARHAESVPVFLEPEEMEGFYEQFSNRVLWPLFHNLPTPRTFEHSAWELYKQVNKRFAEEIARVAAPGDAIWVHDYQLALVPHMLREGGVECAIGFFLHIPFPASETFRTLPVREAILRGMLGANLVGFHAYEYLAHFRSASLRILGVEPEPDPEALAMPTHHARLAVLPIGIDPAEIARLADSRVAREQYEALAQRYRGKRVILGVDRLDYTKGLPRKLLAIEELLEKHPELRGEVVFIQVAAPSRMAVTEYQKLKRELDELVGRVNGRFGTLDWAPVVYINRNVTQDKLTALYRLADIMLVTPLRDGMNLVCLEYIAARGDRAGTLVLSEFTGAATCLSGACLVNPYNPSQIAEALAEALAAPAPSAEAFEHMREFVVSNTSAVWAHRFLARLEAAYQEFGGREERLRIGEPHLAAMLGAAQRPLMLLDYDGTLQPHSRVPREAVPTPALLELLSRLAELATVYVLSGRSAEILEEWLGHLPIGLVCEHGLAIKHPQGAWSDRQVVPSRALEEIVLPMFLAFSERTPGSRIERKTASIAWHYRGCDPKFGSWRAKELRVVLEGQLASQPYTVLSGARVIEVRHVQVTKGNALRAVLDRYPEADFIVCVGNDRTDQEMFDALASSGREPRLVVRVGGGRSGGGYFVETPKELLAQLAELVRVWTRTEPT